MSAGTPDYDVLIVGAGISGIGMAAHLKEHCPTHSFGILERRNDIGGTWDLFRYPGIRSDSDMHTLGFVFEPWRHEKSIADGPAILEYLERISKERGIHEKIHFGHKVKSADFHKKEAKWYVEVEFGKDEVKVITANFLYLGSGYYDYDNPYDAGFDFSEFNGKVIHPQFWPENLDYEGKKVVVVGSGATAVTIVPSMAEKAGHVTMLQRTPTWMFSRPAKDAVANFLRKVLPEKIAYAITRFKNIRMQDFTFKMARNKPQRVKDRLHSLIKKSMGQNFDLSDFTPPYNPWEQRLCLVPDDDLFVAMKSKKASVVTGNIDRFESDGVRLVSGELIEADIIVTATGLKLAIAGKIDVRISGKPVKFEERYYYKGVMFSNLPNLAVVFGYLNASWTLRADINSEFVCRVLNEMKRTKSSLVTPVLSSEAEAALDEDDLFDFSSGYIQRGKHIMPKSATEYPWRLNQDYIFDRKVLKTGSIDDGLLTFTKTVESGETLDVVLEAAE